MEIFRSEVIFWKLVILSLKLLKNAPFLTWGHFWQIACSWPEAIFKKKSQFDLRLYFWDQVIFDQFPKQLFDGPGSLVVNATLW